VHTLGEHQILFATMKCVYTIYSLSGEQEEQTEEHGPEVEEQEPLPEDSEGDAKASSDTELEGGEKLEHIAASTDETQEMSND